MASLFQEALQDASLGLVDSNNAPLLSPNFWLQPMYTDLLNAGSRFRAIKAKEVRRPATSLVKVMCVPYTGLAAALHRGKRKVETSRVSLLGDKCWAGSLLVWFPASWMPLVVEVVQAKNVAASTHPGHCCPLCVANPHQHWVQTEKVARRPQWAKLQSYMGRQM